MRGRKILKGLEETVQFVLGRPNKAVVRAVKVPETIASAPCGSNNAYFLGLELAPGPTKPPVETTWPNGVGALLVDRPWADVTIRVRVCGFFDKGQVLAAVKDGLERL
jgi:hypothetical protein